MTDVKHNVKELNLEDVQADLEQVFNVARRPRRHSQITSATAMRVIAIQAKTERKRQVKSA